MAKRHDLRRFVARRSYSMSELSELLNVHIRTVQSWHKQGMIPIDPDDRPYLFKGWEVKRFLHKRQAARKCRVGEHEFYCPRCKSSVTSTPADIMIIRTGRRIGRNDMQAIVKGKCRSCRCILTRFSTEKKLKRSKWALILEQAQPGLKGYECATLNTDFRGGRNGGCKQSE